LDKLVIRGGTPLNGAVQIGGAKNAAVAIIPAAILSGGVCRLHNIPDISDVRVLGEILRELGCGVKKTGEHSLEIDAAAAECRDVDSDNAREMRASYYFLGAMISRYGRGAVVMPGGCNLGARPIDQHLKAFEALGCETRVENDMVYVDAHGKLRGAHVFFDICSVGATINAMLAAVKAEGTTVLENVAKEPHVVDVANFLNRMGGDVRGAGTDMIKIRGVKELHGAEYSIIPDQIEAGTFIAAAIATGGDVTISSVTPKHLESIISRIRAVGGSIDIVGDSLRVRRCGPLKPCSVLTRPHPGFPTDMVPQFSVLLSLAQGRSKVTEGIWSNRFRFAGELRKMGAEIEVDGPVAEFSGVEKLRGAEVTSTDLRAGAAMVIAGLCAEGVTEVGGLDYIDRGYEDFVGKMKLLGADIERISKD
jgi:UDP-N-acetylglucosamine 1-carboxyvinyltransferase